MHSHPIREACDCQFLRTTSRIFASIRSKQRLNLTFSARITHPRNDAGCIIRKVVLLDGYDYNAKLWRTAGGRKVPSVVGRATERAS